MLIVAAFCIDDRRKIKKNSIVDIAESKLCCCCGACGWACPEGAISYVETVGGYLLPSVDLAACTDCGVCISICPSAGLAPALASCLPSDPFSGTALRTYVGKATDVDLYANSQSGGIVSALLSHALQTGKIGGVVTTVMVAGNPPRAKARLAKSFEEIRQAQKSKYCLVPLLSIMDEIEEFIKPVAVVGVGCQVQGLNNLCERFQSLKEKIAFTIGLVCDRTMTYGAIDYLLKRANVPSEGSKILHFRDKSCGGYPGNVNLICSSGDSVSLPSSVRKAIKDFFTPARCRICFDKMNILSDITVGDPWGIGGVDSVRGESVAVIRTEVGAHMFQRAISDGALTVREIEYQQVLVGQAIEKKRSNWNGYINAWNKLGHTLPTYCQLVKPYSGDQQSNLAYRRNLQHSLALDQYSSRDVLITAIKRKLFFPKLKRKAVWAIRAISLIIRKLLKKIIERTH